MAQNPGVIAGIDPGLSGAVALFGAVAGAVIDVADMPVLTLMRGSKAKREVDGHLLADLLAGAGIAHAYVENVGAMPGQGVSGVFAFGKAFGTVLGVLAALGVPMTLVAPASWKRALHVPAAKDGARARASQLMPTAAQHWRLVKHDGRAEAALIAYYGATARPEGMHASGAIRRPLPHVLAQGIDRPSQSVYEAVAPSCAGARAIGKGSVP